MAEKKIHSYKFNEKRKLVPSTEEAGLEDSNAKVQEAEQAEFPKNPIVHRGQDPELFWMHKYGSDDKEDMLKVDIRSLYRHEHISPELLLRGLYNLKDEKKSDGQLSLLELFGNDIAVDELEKPHAYYSHEGEWKNRLIQGDSLLVMTSLLEREGMAGKVQCIYMDPPYGIKYGSNWQMKLNNRDVKDGNDDSLTGEPEMIKAYRDTWELGIHSYLSYLRDRLMVARELLTESGSCFVQISDENVHLVRNVMDEVFGSENFCKLITFRTTAGDTSKLLPTMGDYSLWYSKNSDAVKYRKVIINKTLGFGSGDMYDYVESPDFKTIRKLTKDELMFPSTIPKGWRIFRIADLKRLGFSNTNTFEFEFEGKKFYCGDKYQWKTTKQGMEKLKKAGWLIATSNTLNYKRYFEHFPVTELGNFWTDTQGASEKNYVVQTSNKVIQRCILMSTDPGDLVLDPTCGSGTTAYVAEQWGRRWITTDTSRIALNIAKTRLMTAVYKYYTLYDEKNNTDRKPDIRNGFIYKTVPHITLKSLANDEPPETETLYDQPQIDNKKMRVCGPFTVETLQNYEPLSPAELDAPDGKTESGDFQQKIFEHLKSAGIKNGLKNETAKFISAEPLADTYIHAVGYYETKKGQSKAFIHIGPQFGTVSRLAVNEFIKTCRNHPAPPDWAIILGFSFESNISNTNETVKHGSFEVTKVRMHDDLLQEGLLKRDKKAASFMTIGEPDIRMHFEGEFAQVEVAGMDLYDPIKDIVRSIDKEDIAYWMVDDDYDGSNFIVKQVFFCGGDDKFDDWRKALEKTIKVEIDEEAWQRLYDHKSHPIPFAKGKKIAVRVISQFGEECMKVMEM